jgi:hypothetical protein
VKAHVFPPATNLVLNRREPGGAEAAQTQTISDRRVYPMR